MVDRDDIPILNALNAEKTMLQQAVQNLNSPQGHIIAITIIGPMTAQRIPPVTIDTTGWEYPPQMVEAIKTNLDARLAEVRKELADLGVTGLDR